jgi:hypothetical protein
MSQFKKKIRGKKKRQTKKGTYYKKGKKIWTVCPDLRAA